MGWDLQAGERDVSHGSAFARLEDMTADTVSTVLGGTLPGKWNGERAKELPGKDNNVGRAPPPGIPKRDFTQFIHSFSSSSDRHGRLLGGFKTSPLAKLCKRFLCAVAQRNTVFAAILVLVSQNLNNHTSF